MIRGLIARIRNWTHRHFGFTESQTNGFVIMFLMLLILLTIPYFFRVYITSVQQEWVRRAQLGLSENLPEETIDIKKGIEETANKTDNATLNRFDINSSSVAEMVEAGVPSKLATTIVKYRIAAGGFKRPQQITRLYGIDSSMARQIIAFTVFPILKVGNYQPIDASPPRYNTQSNYPELLVPDIELNSVDSVTLISFPGIGPSGAHHILEARRKLRYFVRKEQLFEVWGIDSNLIDKKGQYFSVDTSGIWKKRINLNTTSETDLKSHPYIGYKLAKVFMAYRKQHGPYKTVDDLMKTRVLRPEDFRKIKDYVYVTQ